MVDRIERRPHPGRWLSGRKHPPAKRVGGVKLPRGFESLPSRSSKCSATHLVHHHAQAPTPCRRHSSRETHRCGRTPALSRFSEMERKEAGKAGKDGQGVGNGKREITIIPDAFFWTGLGRGFSPRTRAAGMWSAPLPLGLRDRAHPPHPPLHWTLSAQRLGACPRRQDLPHQAER